MFPFMKVDRSDVDDYSPASAEAATMVIVAVDHHDVVVEIVEIRLDGLDELGEGVESATPPPPIFAWTV